MSGGNAERVGPVSRDEGKGQARHSHLELSTLWDFEFPYPALLVSLRDQWRGVHRGMTKEQIGSVLGPPTRMLEINSKPLWYSSTPSVPAPWRSHRRFGRRLAETSTRIVGPW